MGLPTILAAAGTAFNVVGALAEGDSEAQNYQYQAAVSRYNAEEGIREGDIQATTSGLKTRAQVGAIKAAQAGSGIDVNSGSAVDIQAAQSQLGALDALTIRSNAARRAYGYRLDAQNLERGASDARTGSLLRAGASLIGGASSTFSTWKKWQDTGVGTDDGSPSVSGVGSSTNYVGSEWEQPFDLGFAHG